jgi:hypothetical protein
MCHPGALHTVAQRLNRDLERALLTFARNVIDQALLPERAPEQPTRATAKEIVRRSQ